MKRAELFLVVLLGCGGGSNDANVANNYSMTVTNRDNGCMFSGYNVGAQSNGGLPVAQDGSKVTARATGSGAVLLDLVVGSNVFTGNVDGKDVDLEIVGVNGFTMGNCAYTFDAELHATAGRDSLSGRIEYRSVTNNDTDCSTIKDCLTFQEFKADATPP